MNSYKDTFEAKQVTVVWERGLNRIVCKDGQGGWFYPQYLNHEYSPAVWEEYQGHGNYAVQFETLQEAIHSILASEDEPQQLASLSDMTPEQLYETNLPLRHKLDSHQPLTEQEQALHEAICQVVLSKMEAQRATELAVRLASQEPNWKTCQCESCQFVRSTLLG